MRPLAWGDSFGFRQVITRSRDVTEPGQLAGLKIRTIQSPIYVKAVELMGASPTPMAFGEVYTSLQTGVIDGYEHDASTTLQQRFYEIARYMARTRHIAGVLGLWASTVEAGAPARRTSARRSSGAALEAARHQRAMGPQEDTRRPRSSPTNGMTIREIDGRAFQPAAERLWETRGARARRHVLARGDSRVTAHRRTSPGRRVAVGSSRSSGRSRSSSSPRPPSWACRSSAATSCTSRSPGPRRSPGCCWSG